jgi:hypothetical protein
MIKFARLADGYVVHASRPSVRDEWHSLHPMSAAQAFAELKNRGADLVEIKLALSAADPDWRKPS